MDVPYVEGSLAVNIGDLMMQWTNDQWISTLHRVVNPPADSPRTTAASRWCSSTNPTTTP